MKEASHEIVIKLSERFATCYEIIDDKVYGAWTDNYQWTKRGYEGCWFRADYKCEMLEGLFIRRKEVLRQLLFLSNAFDREMEWIFPAARLRLNLEDPQVFDTISLETVRTIDEARNALYKTLHKDKSVKPCHYALATLLLDALTDALEMCLSELGFNELTFRLISDAPYPLRTVTAMMLHGWKPDFDAHFYQGCGSYENIQECLACYMAVTRTYGTLCEMAAAIKTLNATEKSRAEIRVRSQFYQTKKWKTLRSDVLHKHPHICACCGEDLKGKPKHVDHIRPRSKYPELELDYDNMQLLCEACNMGKGNRYETDFRPEELRA